MARIRSIKPEFWDDEKLAKLPRDVRLLYIGLWTFSDDFGVVKSNPVWLKSRIFPFDDIQLPQFQKWLMMLERPGFSSPGGSVAWAVQFQANGEAFYYLPNFSRHQRVEKPSTFNRNPEPPKDIANWTPTPTEVLQEVSGSPPGILPAVLEGKGEEGKGKENTPLPPAGGRGRQRVVFVKPTVEEVRAYGLEIGSAVDPEAFWDYWESVGWRRKGGPMADWKATFRNRTRDEIANPILARRRPTSEPSSLQPEFRIPGAG